MPLGKDLIITPYNLSLTRLVFPGAASISLALLEQTDETSEPTLSVAGIVSFFCEWVFFSKYDFARTQYIPEPTVTAVKTHVGPNVGFLAKNLFSGTRKTRKKSYLTISTVHYILNGSFSGTLN